MPTQKQLLTTRCNSYYLLVFHFFLGSEGTTSNEVTEPFFFPAAKKINGHHQIKMTQISKFQMKNYNVKIGERL
jgi:hypothetical protein